MRKRQKRGDLSGGYLYLGDTASQRFHGYVNAMWDDYNQFDKLAEQRFKTMANSNVQRLPSNSLGCGNLYLAGFVQFRLVTGSV